MFGVSMKFKVNVKFNGKFYKKDSRTNDKDVIRELASLNVLEEEKSQKENKKNK